MKLTDEQIAEFRAEHAEVTRLERVVAVARMRLQTKEVELHINCPAGEAFDIWGDGESKAPEDCKPPPGTKK